MRNIAKDIGVHNEKTADYLHLATPWQRFWANIIDDMLLVVFPAMLLVGMRPIVQNLWALAAYAFFFCSLGLVIKTLLISKVGTTPGKWLFGLKVITEEDRRLPFDVALNRTSQSWVYGAAIGIPVANTIAMIISGIRVDKTGRSKWDTNTSTKVVCTKPWWRTAIGLLVWFMLSVLMALAITIQMAQHAAQVDRTPDGHLEAAAKNVYTPAYPATDAAPVYEPYFDAPVQGSDATGGERQVAPQRKLAIERIFGAADEANK